MTATTSRPMRAAIFGATSGIGVAVARRLAAQGAQLVLVGRDPEALAAEGRDLTVRGAPDIIEITADFAALDTIDATAAWAWETFDGLDLALVTYGSLPDQAALDRDPDGATAALSLNFVSQSVLAMHLARHFEAQGSGTIAIITSVAGDRGRKSNYLYGAAKGGLQKLTEGLRHRLYARGVQVLDIRPGFVMTPMTEHLTRGGFLWAEPDKVATDILRAVTKRRAVIYTPWFWRIILMIVRALPRPLFHRSSL